MDMRTRISFQRSGLPRRFWVRDIVPQAQVKAWWDDSTNILFDMAADTYGQGLVLCGPQATAQAAWLFRECLSDDLPTLWVDWSALADDIRDRDERGAAVDDALHPSVLIIDQVDMNRQEWLSQVLTRIIKGRYDAGKPTILTTFRPVDTARSALSICFDFDPNVVSFVETLGAEG